MTSAFLLYLGASKLLIYLGQMFLQANVKSGFLKKLSECDLCFGTWVCCALAVAFQITILDDVLPRVFILSEIVTGCVSTFLLHLLTLGWKTKFDVIVI